MKRISLLLNVVLLVFIIGYSCSRPTQPDEPDKDTDCLVCDTPFNGVLAHNFMEVVARYRRTHWDVLNQNANSEDNENDLEMNTTDEDSRAPIFQDSRCVWFSLDTLKKFVCYVEKYANSVGVQNNQLGIRFYYAVYPGKPTQDFTAEEYEKRFGQHTLYMVPTRQSEEKEEIDWDPKRTYELRHSGDTSKMRIPNDSAYVDLAEFLSNPANQDESVMIYSSSPKNSYAWNNGKLCPVNCPTASQNTLRVVDEKYPKGLPY